MKSISWLCPRSALLGTCIRTGAAALDKATVAPAARWASTSAGTSESKGPQKERIVVLGSGWAGYAFARALSPSKSSRILISPRSHFVFTPLLASTAVGTLEFRTVLESVRRLRLDEFYQGKASDIDFERKTIRVEANTGDSLARKSSDPLEKGKEFEVAYDKLVLAVGCYSQTFGIEGVKEHACFLRDVGDARAIRLRILQVFEKAALPTTTDEEKSKLLNFAVVGGGPTGIESAAELNDLVHDDMSRLYPQLMRHVGISIYDIAPKVLPMFDQNLASYATELFRRQGIRVKTEHQLERIRRDGDVLMLRIRQEREEVPAGMVVWSTGLMKNPLVGMLTEKDVGGGGGGGGGRLAADLKTGGIVTDAKMRVQVQRPDGSLHTLRNVFAIGDCAQIQDQALPATAQVASQQAAYLARQMNNNSSSSSSQASSGEGEGEGEGFRFRNWGTMAYLGSWRAIHQRGADELKGPAAWVLWRAAYMTKSMSARNKIMIPVYWLINWLFGRDISRF